MNSVIVSGGFDDIKSKHIRFLYEAAKLGEVHVELWSDETVSMLTGNAVKFSEAERIYFLQAIRYVKNISVVKNEAGADTLVGADNEKNAVWAVNETDENSQKKAFCKTNGLKYHVVRDQDIQGFPLTNPDIVQGLSSVKKVVVTGCYDWFHSGHVRFFEEVSELGDLYVVLGSDRNVKLLKGEGHPLFPQDERRFMVQSIRYVKQALVSSGTGWMDAEPEIAKIRPDMYAVNEDGDKPDKREFCEKHGLRYIVLKRTPKKGLPIRQSTNLRGF
jgi:cytidyltransferase-related domain